MALSNYEAVVERFREGAVRHMWWFLLVSTLLLAIEKGLTTFVQAFEAGHKAGKAVSLDPLHRVDFEALKEGMAAAYPGGGEVYGRMFRPLNLGTT